MRLDTQLLRLRLKSLVAPEDRIRALHNRWRGETAYLIACGPSVREYARRTLQNLLGHRLVLAVKQALTVVPNIADFHLLNRKNLVPYHYCEGSAPTAISVSSADMA